MKDVFSKITGNVYNSRLTAATPNSWLCSGEGETPLSVAAENGNDEILQYLLNGCKLTISNSPEVNSKAST